MKDEINMNLRDMQKETINKVKIRQLINFDKSPKNPVKVSIIVPVCNVEIYLRECLDSILKQTLKDIEIICVNDGSKDNSLAILEKYAKSDSRVKIIDKENAGYGHTMNIGMDMASGEYVGIVESDDYINEAMYEKLYGIAKRENLNFIKSDFNRFIYENDKIKLTYFRVLEDRQYYNQVITPRYEPYCFRGEVNTWCGIYSRQFLNKFCIRHNETPGASYQDNGFFFQTYMFAERAYFLDKPFYMNRRDNPNSSVYSNGKMYCMKNEYDRIDSIIEKNPEYGKPLICWSWLKRFQNYIFTLSRLDNVGKKEFLKVFHNEFVKAYNEGKIDSKIFSSVEYGRLTQILNDPDGYYEMIRIYSKKISIIIAMYNAAKLLNYCLDSILAQTLLEFELICVNDGSTDETLEILNEYKKNDPRIIIVNQNNMGAGLARNNGLKFAHGKYVIFLDADDYFYPNFLKNMYNSAEKNRADITVCRCEGLDYKSKEKLNMAWSVEKRFLPTNNPFSWKDALNEIFLIFRGWAWDKLYRFSFLEKINVQFPNLKNSEDFVFVFESLYRANKIFFIDEVLIRQTRNLRGSRSQSRDLNYGCFFEGLKLLKQDLISTELYDLMSKSFINFAAENTVWNYSTLGKQAKDNFILSLKNEYEHELGILSYSIGDFNDINYKKCYEEYKALYNSSNSFEADKQITILNNKYKAIQVKEKLSTKATTSIEESCLNDRLILIYKNEEIIADYIGYLESINDEKEQKILNLVGELNSLKGSRSFKIGRMVTWPLRCLRDKLRMLKAKWLKNK